MNVGRQEDGHALYPVGLSCANRLGLLVKEFLEIRTSRR